MNCKIDCFNVLSSWQADVINVHDWPGTTVLPKRQHKNQLFMFSTLESPSNPLSSESLRSQFNLFRSYNLDSDVIFNYFPRGELIYTDVSCATVRPHGVIFLTRSLSKALRNACTVAVN